MVRTISFLAGLLTALPVFAHGGGYDVAKVISVTPRYATVNVPRQECYTETVYESPDRSYGGAIIGGVAGGLLGSQVGKGNGNKVATAVGAATGAIIGDRIDNDHMSPRAREVERCRTVNTTRRTVDGYNVVYKYDGRRYTTVMDHDPGPTIRVPATQRVVYVKEHHYIHDAPPGWRKHHKHKHKHKHYDDDDWDD